MKYFLFAISLVIAILTARRVAARLPRGDGAGFWLTILVVLVSFGATTQITSLASWLRPWGVLLVQAGILAAVWWKVLPAAPGRMKKSGAREGSTPCWALLFLIGLFLILNVIHVATAPIVNGDDVNYNASGPAYWVQNGSVFPRLTHNYRQYLIHSGGEYLFLWPILFTRNEPTGRILFWLCVPLTLAGVYFLARKLGASREFALSAATLLAFAPQFHSNSIVRKPELWIALFLCGACWFLADAWQGDDRRTTSLGVSAAFVGLASSARVLYSPLLLFPILLALRGTPEARRRRAIVVVGSFLVAALAWGYFSPFVFGWKEFGHPLGPVRIREEFSHRWDWQTVRTYLVRTCMSLIETPELPPHSGLRSSLETVGQWLMEALGADRSLEGESSAGAWPGTYSFMLNDKPTRYALGGLLGLLSLFLVIGSYVSRGVRRRGWKVDPLELIAAFGALALLVATLPVRWQSQSGIPIRLMVSPLAVLLGVGAAWATRVFGLRPVWAGLLLFATFYNSAPILQWASTIASQRMREPPPTARELDGPFHEALQHVSDGSRILYVGGVNSADYPLFGAYSGYSRIVLPWGPHAFGERRMTAVLEKDRPSHVLIESRNAVHVGIAPEIDTGEMGAWLAAQPGWVEIPLPNSAGRLFRRRTWP